MLEAPLARKSHNYPRDFQPSSKDNKAKGQRYTMLSPTTERYSMSVESSPCSGAFDEGITKDFSNKISQGSIIKMLNPEQKGKMQKMYSGVGRDDEAPLISQRVSRKMPYINADLLRPKIVDKTSFEMKEQEDQIEINPSGAIKKNMTHQKALAEQEPYELIKLQRDPISKINSASIFNERKLLQIQRQTTKLIKQPAHSVENSFRVTKRQSSFNLSESKLRARKDMNGENKHLQSFGHLLEQSKIDKLKAHINKFMLSKTHHMRISPISLEEASEADSEYHGRYQQRLNRQKQSRIFNSFNQTSKSGCLSTRNNVSKIIPQAKKVTVSYKTSLNQLKLIAHNIAKLHYANIEVVIPKILMEFNPDKATDKPQLFTEAQRLFQQLGLPSDNLTVKRYSNCVLMVSRNIGIVKHYEGKVYLGGWQNLYLDEGAKYGLGLQWSPNRYIYYGEFVESKREGLGIMKTRDEVFIGEWMRGRKAGQGQMVNRNGEIFDMRGGYGKHEGFLDLGDAESDPFM